MDFRISAVLALGLATAFTHRPCAADPNRPSAATSTARAGSAVPLTARAPESPSPTPDRPAQLISLTVAAETKESKRLEAVAAELLGRLSVNVHFRQVESINLDEIVSPRRSSVPYLACAYIDLRTPGTATLYLVDPVHDRVLVRRVERVAGGEEVTREQLGHILETSAEGLLAGMRIGMPRQEIAPTLVQASSSAISKAPAAPAVRVPAKPSFGHLGVLYEGEATSAGTPITHGPVLGLLGHHAIDRMTIGLWLLAQYRWSYQLDSQPVGARVGGGALRLLATLDVREGEAVSWRFAVGGGADLVNLRPTSSGSEGVTLAASRWLTFAVLRAEIAGRLRLGGIGHLLAAAFADIDPSNTRYVFGARSGPQIVLRPWMVRPGLSLGVELP